MAKEDFCERCSRYAGCGFISRNLQTKCDILQIFEEGYEQGYEETIDKACEWLGNDFEELTRLHLDDIVIDKFCKAMKGGEE